MKLVNSYVTTILAAALSAAVVELLAPRGEGARIAAHVRMIAGLFLLVALLQPLKEGILILRSAMDGNPTDRISDMLSTHTSGNYEDAFYDTVAGIGKEKTEDWVRSALQSSFGIPTSGCRVQAVCDAAGEGVALTELRISLHGKYALENPHPIEAYMSEQLGCPCYVTVGD